MNIYEIIRFIPIPYTNIDINLNVSKKRSIHIPINPFPKLSKKTENLYILNNSPNFNGIKKFIYVVKI